MKKLLLGLAALPLCIGMAVAAQPLTSHQMDGITAGFSAISIADAEGLVNKGQAIVTTTGSVSQITPYATGTVSVAGLSAEVSATVFKSLSAAQSSSVSSNIPTLSLGLSDPNPCGC